MNRFEQKVSTFMGMAIQLATLATCPKRKVGCILLDKNLRIIGSGYNGVASGEPHCDGKNCTCIHAEVNALDWCSDLSSVAYVITKCAPCADCFGKIMANLPAVKTIYFLERSKNSCQMIGCDSECIALFTPRWAASKVGGSYQASGIIINEFDTKAGDKRVVFEFDEPPGMLHIFTPKQVLGSRTKQLVPCFGTKPALSSKQVDEYNCRACQLKSECEKKGYNHDLSF